MKRTILTFALLSSLTFGARAITVNFDELTGTGTLPSNYAGLTWLNWVYNDAYQPPYTPSSGTERIRNNREDAVNYVGTIKFGGAVTFNSLWMAGYALDQWVEGYLGGVLKCSSTHTPNNSLGFGQTFNLNWANVDEIRVQANNPIHDYYIIDDVTYSPASVPDAGATLVLLGLAMPGLAAVRRFTGKGN